MLQKLLYFVSLISISELKILSTSYGKLEGATVSSLDYNHKYMFKAVPYAKPPTGNLRFSLPENPEPWEGVRDATDYSASCLANWTHTRYPVKSFNEDCLYINIFTSEKCLRESCAVIVYYHGGAFKMDAATMFPDEFILERYVAEDIVFAIPAFRLGAMGQLFFGHSDIVPENLFMFDAVHALKFVNKEITHFGGDPNRVTIFGHSTGGLIVNSIGCSNLIDPDRVLFQQMIVLSPPGEYAFPDFAVNASLLLAEKLDCLHNNQTNTIMSTPDILSCLREIDAFRILAIQSEIISENELMFRNIIKGAPMMKFDETIENFKKNALPRNILYGTNELEFQVSNEGRGPHSSGSFMDFENPYDVINHFYDLYAYHQDDWIEMDSAGAYISARTVCEAMVKAGADAYLFEIRQQPMSTHLSDMQYFMGIHREMVHTPDMDIVDSFYSKLLVNFTKTGVPSPNWEKLDLKRANYLEIKVDSIRNIGPTMKDNYHENEMKLWYGDMMDYDRKLTREKKNKSASLYNTSTELKDNYSIFNQWWFYVGIFILFTVLVFLIFCARKHGNEEAIPLLR